MSDFLPDDLREMMEGLMGLYDLAYLEDLLDSFSGTINLNGEFNPKEPCIKFSSIIGYNDEKENLHIIKEKYVLFDLRTQCDDFWNLANKLKTYIH